MQYMYSLKSLQVFRVLLFIRGIPLIPSESKLVFVASSGNSVIHIAATRSLLGMLQNPDSRQQGNILTQGNGEIYFYAIHLRGVTAKLNLLYSYVL